MLELARYYLRQEFGRWPSRCRFCGTWGPRGEPGKARIACDAAPCQRQLVVYETSLRPLRAAA